METGDCTAHTGETKSLKQSLRIVEEQREALWSEWHEMRLRRGLRPGHTAPWVISMILDLILKVMEKRGECRGGICTL